MKTGDIFDERYRIVKILGKGGMSVVYLAENIKVGSLWAVKEIFKIQNERIDIKSEFRILKRLSHTALPRIFDITESEDSFFIIEDYIEGDNLDVVLKKSGKLEETRVVQIALELCEVLEYLHGLKPNPVIYRDMKPSNIILTSEGEIKLIDFGIAREFKNESADDTVYIGTKGYAAPEQYGLGQTNERTDIYNLGMTLHHLVTGKNPNEVNYSCKPIRSYDAELSQTLEQIIEKCIAFEPDERYQNVEELKKDLDILKNNYRCMGGDEKIRGFRGEDENIQIFEKNFKKTSALRFNKRRNSEIYMKHFKKVTVSCFGSGEFVAEFAYIFARLSTLEVLIINLNFERQNLDLYLNLVPDIEKRIRDNTDFGMKYVSKIAERKYLTPEILKDAVIKAAELPNLSILVDAFYPAENSDNEKIDIDSIIRVANRAFDVIIFSAENYNDSKIINSAIENSNFNIIATTANIDSMRKFQRREAKTNDKSELTDDNFKFAAFEYKEGINLSVKNIRRLIGKDNYIGSIKYNNERERFRNINSIFVKKYYKDLKNEYIPIFENLNLIEKT